jgi:hypothetical protein
VIWLQVTANVAPSSPILVTLMMVAILFSENSVLTRATWRNIPEDGIFRKDCCYTLHLATTGVQLLAQWSLRSTGSSLFIIKFCVTTSLLSLFVSVLLSEYAWTAFGIRHSVSPVAFGIQNNNSVISRKTLSSPLAKIHRSA